jgi:hypothetical protein
MNYYQLITILIGLLILFWGFWAAFEAKKPWNLVGAISAPVGLITALIGTLLLFVPNFFK